MADAAAILAGLLQDQEQRMQRIADTDTIDVVVEKTLKKKKLSIEGSLSCLNIAAVKNPYTYPAIIEKEGLTATAQLQGYFRHFAQAHLADQQCALITGIANMLALTKGKVPVAQLYEGLLPILSVLNEQHTYLLTKQLTARAKVDASASEIFASLGGGCNTKTELDINAKISNLKKKKGKRNMAASTGKKKMKKFSKRQDTQVADE